MNYSSKERIESKTCQGVVFVIRKLTEGRRIELSLALAETYDKLHLLRREAAKVATRAKSLLAEADAARIAGDINKLAEINNHPDTLETIHAWKKYYNFERDSIWPVYCKMLLHSVEGLEVDDNPAPPEMAIKDGPPELYEEILAAVKKQLGLTEEEQGNSESPITSNALGDGRVTTTSAEPVNSGETGGNAAAGNTAV
ncbi:MAG: hypothetical protein IT168_33285 [Bryobacterales bacterium]|nr:hypothetical protein [Bryobacterales bacterium]